MMKKILLNAALLIFTLSTGAASASIIIDGGPAWPGMADVSGSTHPGNMIQPGGQLSTYPNIGLSPVANLYFGLSSNGLWSLGTRLRSETPFTFQYATGNTIGYSGTMQLYNAQNGTTYNYSTQLRMTALIGATVVTDATTQALANGVNSLFHITGPVFQVRRELLINGQAAQTFYDNFPTHSTDQLQTNVGTGFYWENASVPGPATIGLMLVGLAGIVAARRRSSH